MKPNKTAFVYGVLWGLALLNLTGCSDPADSSPPPSSPDKAQAPPPPRTAATDSLRKQLDAILLDAQEEKDSYENRIARFRVLEIEAQGSDVLPLIRKQRMRTEESYEQSVHATWKELLARTEPLEKAGRLGEARTLYRNYSGPMARQLSERLAARATRLSEQINERIAIAQRLQAWQYLREDTLMECCARLLERSDAEVLAELAEKVRKLDAPAGQENDLLPIAVLMDDMLELLQVPEGSLPPSTRERYEQLSQQNSPPSHMLRGLMALRLNRGKVARQHFIKVDTLMQPLLMQAGEHAVALAQAPSPERPRVDPSDEITKLLKFLRLTSPEEVPHSSEAWAAQLKARAFSERQQKILRGLGGHYRNITSDAEASRVWSGFFDALTPAPSGDDFSDPDNTEGKP